MHNDINVEENKRSYLHIYIGVVIFPCVSFSLCGLYLHMFFSVYFVYEETSWCIWLVLGDTFHLAGCHCEQLGKGDIEKEAERE